MYVQRQDEEDWHEVFVVLVSMFPCVPSSLTIPEKM